MDKFVSISVNQGDAFYLERSGVKILVDGGRSRGGFGRQFLRTIGSEALDIVVCTHADADHIDGLLGYFDEGLKTKEVWLPGVWTGRLADLLEQPEDFVRELVDQVHELQGTLPTKLADLDGTFPQVRQEEEHIQSDGFDGIYRAIETSGDRADNPRVMTACVYNEMWHYFGIGHRAVKLVLDALDTAGKIRELAVLAYHSGARIRWFEYLGNGPASGGEPHLRPVNSKEIFGLKKHMGALEYLYLSIENKQSLVFHSPATDQAGDVVFSADSDYSFDAQLLALSESVIITAPHHGSQSNSNAYVYLKEHVPPGAQTFYIRSDGRFKSRPGSGYKAATLRVCTLCRHVAPERQDVVLTAPECHWVLGADVLPCYCDEPDVDYVAKARLELKNR